MSLSSSTWTLQPNAKSSTSSVNGLVYERPLDLAESLFYWDGTFEGTADTLDNSELEVESARFEEIISSANISKTWSAVKQQFPLLGATIEERDPNSLFFVVVTENLLCCHRPEEIIFQDVASAEEAGDLAISLIANGRRLSNDLLARIWILRRTDRPNTFNFIFHLAHCITDGMSNITIKKTFLDLLCRGPTAAPDLVRQIALSEASQNLYPNLKYSLARRRWRTAIAKIISARRSQKLTGGHTIPRKVSQVTPFTPADSRTVVHVLSAEKSRRIIANCRNNHLTFGNAYPIEWEFRKKEPMSSAGPLNLRRFLDQKWIDAGGLDHVCLSIGFLSFTLPFMPLGSASSIRPGMELPSFGTLLSKERFMLRSRSIKDQTKNYMKHPLFIEFGEILFPTRLERGRTVALQWRNEKAPPKALTDTPFSPIEQASRGIVIGNGGSSMGNVDLLLPREYPLNRQPSEKPIVFLRDSMARLHCRPTELYLGAATSKQQLRLLVHWDNNVTDEVTVMEWLEEVKNAVDFYLAQDNTIQARL